MECTMENYSSTLAAGFFTVCLLAFSLGGFVGYVIAISGGITVNDQISMLKNQHFRLSAKGILNINDSIILRISFPQALKSVGEDRNRLIFQLFDLTNPSWEAIDASYSKLGESQQERALCVPAQEAEDSPCKQKRERWISVRERIDLFERLIKKGANVTTPPAEQKKRKKRKRVKTVLDRFQGFGSAFDAMFDDHRYEISDPVAKFFVTHDRSS
ncbi:hypothetical protein H6P81_003012 [Aristolochia fimbriata]|uniref:Uncharacterized protein n=1 Tax=Aristolochia fimbriata TaxID=158543 RepID=A0AAV7FBY4_ARIFI|nr:hypothetical protein H6P81_003012 [Aristolochia fimbriata]